MIIKDMMAKKNRVLLTRECSVLVVSLEPIYLYAENWFAWLKSQKKAFH